MSMLPAICWVLFDGGGLPPSWVLVSCISYQVVTIGGVVVYVNKDCQPRGKLLFSYLSLINPSLGQRLSSEPFLNCPFSSPTILCYVIISETLTASSSCFTLPKSLDIAPTSDSSSLSTKPPPPPCLPSYSPLVLIEKVPGVSSPPLHQLSLMVVYSWRTALLFG